MRCNGHVRLDAMLELADRLGAATLATGHYARVTTDATACCARRRRPAQGPELHARRARAGLARAAALPARRADQAGGARARRARPDCRSRASPTRRISASWRAPAARRFLARHGGIARAARRRSSTATAAALGRHRGHHVFTVGQRRGLGVGGAASRSTCSATDAGANTVTVGPREALVTTRVARARRCGCTAGARATRVRLRYRTRRCRARRCGSTAMQPCSPSRSPAPRRVRPPCCSDGDVVGSDRCRRSDRCDDLRRDPRAVPVVLRGARPPAPAVGVARARRRTTRRCCSRPPACSRSSRTSSGWSSRRTRA